MAGLSDLTDLITGGSNKKSQEALQAALAQINAVQTPTSEQLQLSPLAQYYSTGQLTPAMMQAAQAGPSAYNQENLSGVPMAAMQQALGQEQAIAGAQGMTPQEQAAIAQAEQSMNRNVAGQRGAIEQSFAARGVPQSLISAALQNQTAGQEAQQGYQNALQAQGQAANQGLNALQNVGQLGGQMYAQQAGQANTIAQAQNALNQFNTQNSQQANLANQANQQIANQYGTQNAQNIANQNVGGQQTVQMQNQVNAPQEAAGLALQKAGLAAGVGESQANQATQAGQQSAGLFGGLLGAGATMAAPGFAKPMVMLAQNQNGPIQTKAQGGEIEPPNPQIPATNFLSGGPVDGHSQFPGNDQRNDTVAARLSPGEFVVPRTAMANPNIRNFLAQNVPTPHPMAPTAHPSDIASVIKALHMLRGGQ